jgi:hypothetical protein
MWASAPWESPNYYWVVICKNTKAHQSESLLFGHKIPLAETDAFESMRSADRFWRSATNAAKRIPIAPRSPKARVEGSGGLCDSSTLSMKGAPEVSLMHLLFVPESESNPILDSYS